MPSNHALNYIIDGEQRKYYQLSISSKLRFVSILEILGAGDVAQLLRALAASSRGLRLYSHHLRFD